MARKKGNVDYKTCKLYILHYEPLKAWTEEVYARNKEEDEQTIKELYRDKEELQHFV